MYTGAAAVVLQGGIQLTDIELASRLAGTIREVVRPRIGEKSSRRISGTAASGDATFAIDELAEQAVQDFIHRNHLDIACYTEDTGLRVYGNPERLIVVDPIDGTRPAAAGFESCVVSVAVAPFAEDARMADVRVGCVYEIVRDQLFVAERGKGTRRYEAGVEMPLTTAAATDIRDAAWTAEIVGRPAALVGRVLAEAIDTSALRGGFFILNSSAFSLTRLVTGQLSAVVDVGARIAAETPEAREAFLKAGQGSVLGIFPYDIAAAALIAQEAGCMVTDAWGRSMDDIRLLDSSQANVLTILAASNKALHDQFLRAMERGMRHLPYPL